MHYTDIQIRGFLKLGYFLGAYEKRHPVEFAGIDKQRYQHATDVELIEEGVIALRRTFDQLYDADEDLVVPLSGGLDSRLILASLLERRPAHRIHTYTYGVPHAYDFEIGCSVAKHAGTSHTPISTDKLTYQREELLDRVVATRRQVALLHTPPIRHLQRLFAGCRVWSGFVGDAVAGSHLHGMPSASREEAKRRYLRNRCLVRSVNLHRCDDDAFLPHIAAGTVPENTLTYDEQVLFEEAVPKFTESLALFDGFDYVTPFVNSPWADFMFSAPNRVRQGQRLLRDIATTAFPVLFSLPTKTTLGHPLDASPRRLAISRFTNRVRKLLHQFAPFVPYPHAITTDFDEAFRNSPDLARIARDSLDSLQRRRVVAWLDLDRLWTSHARRLRNLGDALVVLTSLELCIAAGELEEPERAGAA